MLKSGVTLLIIGMSVVFMYLMIMIAAIKFIAALLRSQTSQEEAEQKAASQQSRKRASGQEDKSKLVAVISAAVQAHRSKS